MRFRPLNKWSNPSSCAGLIFFAQILEELLFDYSLDTYKPSAMNSATLCLEALNLINDIENDLIDKSNLDHVLEEIIFSFKKDEVVKTLSPLSLNTLIKKLENTEANVEEVRVLLRIIYSHINLRLYKNCSEQLLLDAIQTPKEKNRIRSLTRNYITTLINLGYSTRFLYSTVRMYFYLRKINSLEDIKGFFLLFTCKEQTYTAVFKVSSLFNHIKDSCDVFDMKVSSTLEGELDIAAKEKSFQISEDNQFLVLCDLKAMDVFSARDIAEKSIEMVSTLNSFFHHKEFAIWQPIVLLLNNETHKARLINKSQNIMLMCPDSKKENASIKLNSFLNNFSFKEMNSFRKFNRSVELHALALKSDSPENQLLNLWIALETIVPSKLSKTKAKINNIIDSIIPFLSLTYVDTLTTRLIKDFCLWNKPRFSKAISTITGSSDREKLIKLLVLPENVPLKNKLFADIKDFHLLRYRAFYISEILSDTSKLYKVLDVHSLKLKWQIRRVYRARNLIVHAGRTPEYIDILIKNIHDYLDTVINQIIILSSDGDKINSIDEAFKFTEIINFEYLAELKKYSGKISSENINQFLVDRKF